jgi:hypothetical protein
MSSNRPPLINRHSRLTAFIPGGFEERRGNPAPLSRCQAHFTRSEGDAIAARPENRTYVPLR